MSSFSYMLAALFAMIPAPFLFRGKLPLELRGASIAMVLLAAEFFIYFVASPTYPQYEILPFRMLALTLCISSLFLEMRRRLFGILASFLWMWIEFFGMLSLSYRGEEFHPATLIILASTFLPIYFLHPYKRESRFILAVLWVAAWIFSYEVRF